MSWAPGEHARLCPSVIHTLPPAENPWPAAEATVVGIYAEQPRLGGVRARFCERCADVLERLALFTRD